MAARCGDCHCAIGTMMTAREIQALLRELAKLLVKNCEAVERAGRMRKAGIAASRGEDDQ